MNKTKDKELKEKEIPGITDKITTKNTVKPTTFAADGSVQVKTISLAQVKKEAEKFMVFLDKVSSGDYRITVMLGGEKIVDR